MASSLKQLAARRRANRIARTEIRRRLGCSYNWVRWLEEGYYTPSDSIDGWRDRYEEALNKAVEDRKARVSN